MKTYLSKYTVARLGRVGWLAYGTREEAEADQAQMTPGMGDGIEEVDRQPGYEPGDEWLN